MTLETIARQYIKVTRLIWLGLGIGILAGVIQGVLLLSMPDLQQAVLLVVIRWLLRFSPYQTLVWLSIILWNSLAIGARFILQTDKKDLRRYLQQVMYENRDLKLIGFAEQSTQLNVRIAFQDILIRLQAVADIPQYDVSEMPEDFFEQSPRRPGQSDEQIILLHANLNKAWLSGEQQPVPVALNEVLLKLTTEQPGAVILGSLGSGKSTTLRWLAYDVASHHKLINRQTSFSRVDGSDGDSLRHQIPILLRISAYADALSSRDKKDLSFEKFLIEHMQTRYAHFPKFVEKLSNQLHDGHCLLLLDGLDEVAGDDLRQRIAENISTFIAVYRRKNEHSYNRLIMSSRIVGYRANLFSGYAHYTLQNLNNEQIKQFLKNWYIAVEKNQMQSAQSGKKLNEAQRKEATRQGLAQADRLSTILDKNPQVRRLAANPLMLTLLALVQRNAGDRPLPHLRVELYRTITRTLINRGAIPPDQIRMTHHLLSRLAYTLHNSNMSGTLYKAQVEEIAAEVMSTFDGKKPEERQVEAFLELLRSSTGLFVESGQGLFSFMHRTFQEYYVAMYLVDEPFDELLTFVDARWSDSIWQEPLLLLIAEKNRKNLHKEANTLIKRVADSGTDYDIILHRDLLFAARCIIGCNAWTTSHNLQRQVARQLIDLYSSLFDQGRYTPLRTEIEQIMLSWLQGQPMENGGDLPPLLQIWQEVLCDAQQPERQQGAAHLLSSFATDLQNISASTLALLIPPLIQLADLQALPCPYPLNQVSARAASQKIATYAAVTLRLLDEKGPAAWLYKQWLEWAKDKPALLERLSQHSLEIGMLLTPVAFPGKNDDTSWAKRLEIDNTWQKSARENYSALQWQLLDISNTCCYPHAYWLKQALDKELDAPATPWRESWDAVLKAEMEKGHASTYHVCLYLRLFIWQNDEKQQQRIVEELSNSFLQSDACREQALIALANTFWREIRVPHCLQELHEPQLREEADILVIRDMLDLQKLYLGYLQKLRDRRNLRYLREQQYLPTLKKLLDLSQVPRFWEMRNLSEIFNLYDIHHQFNTAQLVRQILNLLRQSTAGYSSTILIILYSLILEDECIKKTLSSDIWQDIQAFRDLAMRTNALSREHSLLIATIAYELEIDTPTSPLFQEIPDVLADEMMSLKKQKNLPAQEVKKVLRSCIDVRRLTIDKQIALHRETALYLNSVQAVAWELLKQPFYLERDAFEIALGYLDKNNPIICTAVGLLVQQSKGLSREQRTQIAKRIREILQQDITAYRPIHSLDYIKTWRLDDTLFTILESLVT